MGIISHKKLHEGIEIFIRSLPPEYWKNFMKMHGIPEWTDEQLEDIFGLKKSPTTMTNKDGG